MRDRREVELPLVIIELLRSHNADEDEWQSAIDLFGVIGLAGVLRYIEGLPIFRQHLNKQVSTAALAQVKPTAQTITPTQQVSVTQN